MATTTTKTKLTSYAAAAGLILTVPAMFISLVLLSGTVKVAAALGFFCVTLVLIGVLLRGCGPGRESVRAVAEEVELEAVGVGAAKEKETEEVWVDIDLTEEPVGRSGWSAAAGW